MTTNEQPTEGDLEAIRDALTRAEEAVATLAMLSEDFDLPSDLAAKVRAVGALPTDAPADRVTAEELAEVARLDAVATPGPWHVMGRDGSAPRVARLASDGSEEPVALVRPYEDRVSNAELMAWSRMLLPKLAKAFEDENGRHADTAAMLNVERCEKEQLAAEVTALRAEHRAIGDALDDAGIGTRGPEDTLLARVGRMIADANEQAEALAKLRTDAANFLATFDAPFGGATCTRPEDVERFRRQIEEP